MCIRALLLAIVCLVGVSTVVYALNPVYSPPTRYQRENVRILAISSSVHTAGSGNQEIYIAEIWKEPHSVHHVVKLVDSYASYDLPIRRDLLLNKTVLQMKMRRSAECDVNTTTNPLLAPEAEVFAANVMTALHPRGESVPCFQVDHRATRLKARLQ